MGRVFAATHVDTEKRCALKWLHPERNQSGAMERFKREARAAGRIHHPGIVQIFDVGEHAGASFIVMERLDGKTLRELFDEGPPSVGLAVELLEQAARAVAAAHAAGVLHRDLKPENLVVTPGPRGEPVVKVVDFGISKIDDGDAAGLTRSGVMVGTPLYMAPERLFGEPSDGRADVYALSVILYEALVGRLPYRAETSAALGRLFASGQRPPHPSDERHAVPRLLGDVVLHGLELKAERRLRTASGLADALDVARAELAEPEGGAAPEALVAHWRSPLARTLDLPRPNEIALPASRDSVVGGKRGRRWAWALFSLLLAAAALRWGWSSGEVQPPSPAIQPKSVDAKRPDFAPLAVVPEPSLPAPDAHPDAGVAEAPGADVKPRATAPAFSARKGMPEPRSPTPSRKPNPASSARPQDAARHPEGLGRSGAHFDRGDFY
jgi:serine/threonine protein kinase